MSDQYEIVVGVDGTNAATDALRWAFGHATAHHGRVTAVCVVDPATAAGHQMAEEVLSTAITAALAANPRVQVTGRVLAGRPAERLVDEARTADLLVVGSHGHGRLSTAVLGSTAADCVSLSPTAVVVIPARPGLRECSATDTGAVAMAVPVAAGPDQ